MKIEKISEDQIRCTLTKEDLARRGMKVSELAYGTEKARELFHEMMEEAGEKFGFVVDDMPVMVEAIPVNSDCIVLVITKTDDPEELDTRFANFAPNVYYEEGEDGEGSYDDTDFESIFSRIQEGGMQNLFDGEYPAANKVKKKVGGGKKTKYKDDAEYRIFSFPLLRDIIRIAKRVDPAYHGKNTLYRNKETDRYILLLHRQKKDDPMFSLVCLMLSEYGEEEPAGAASEQFLNEHNEVVLRESALQTLRG